MAIVPRDFLEQAEALVAQAETLPDVPRREALLRAAASRAYYATFHEALSQAKRNGFVQAPAAYGSHEALWGWWYAGERPNLALSMLGKHLKDERVRADYRLRETFSVVGTRAILEDAKAAFDAIRAG